MGILGRSGLFVKGGLWPQVEGFGYAGVAEAGKAREAGNLSA